MDRDTAVNMCLDRASFWMGRVRGILDGTVNTDAVAAEVRADANEGAAPLATDKKKGKPAVAEDFDIETASREQLVARCLELGSTEIDTKGKRVQTLREMITTLEQVAAAAPAEASEPVKPKQLSLPLARRKLVLKR